MHGSRDWGYFWERPWEEACRRLLSGEHDGTRAKYASTEGKAARGFWVAFLDWT
jgi:hypothetical protein